MEPDDLLCSRNARPPKALVGRAQWKINQPPSLERNEQAWSEHVYRPMRAGKDGLGIPFIGEDQKELDFRRLLKRPDFSPAQPWRAETRLSQAKPQAIRNQRRTLWGTLRISMS